jgi:hypothetical protein
MFTQDLNPETGRVERRIRKAVTPAEYVAQAEDLEVTVAMLMFAQEFIESHGFREEYETLKAQKDFDNYGDGPGDPVGVSPGVEGE